MGELPSPASPASTAIPGWVLAGETDVGRVRDHNEDAFLLLPGCRLVCVCDGMGGHASGEVASGLAVETLRSFFGYALADLEATWPFKLEPQLSLEANRLVTAIRLAATRIHAQAAGNPAQRGMGTTLVAAVLGEGRAVIAHIGDSRAYLFRAGAVEAITRDHSLLEQFIAARQPSAAEIALFPHKNVITRTLGLDPNVRPDVREIEVQPGDVLLLCSDGLTGMIPDATIGEILSAEPDLRLASRRLLDAANAGGGKDNVTVVLARAG